MIEFITENSSKALIAETVLRDLPEWFGIEESLMQYVHDVQNMMFWVSKEGDNIQGFLALNPTSEDAVDIHVIGVKRDFHGKGIGTKLVDAAQHYAKQKYSYMQVKTIEEGKYEAYDKTVAFYKACGFKKLEVFPTLWDESNPCLIMIKGLTV